MTSSWVRLGVVGSSNDEANRLGRDGAADGTFVTATAQTAGRGRRGATFVSPAGNLYSSWIVRPMVAPARAPELGFVAGLAVADTVEAFAPPATRIELKWPNDVRADGAKIAGILLESETSGGALAFVVVGIGINAVSHPANLPYAATSLAALGATDATPDTVGRRLLTALQDRREQWQGRGFAAIRDAWLARAVGLGGDVRVDLGTTSFAGRFADLDADGALIVALPDGGSRRVTAGDVFLGATP